MPAKVQNLVFDLTYSTDTLGALQSIYDASKGKGGGSIRCTVSKHRISKTAIIFGAKVLLKLDPRLVLGLVEYWAPKGRSEQAKEAKVPKSIRLVCECSKHPGLTLDVDRLWEIVSGKVSHQRIMGACLCLGLDSLSRVDPGSVRLLISKVCPVQKKYWDEELGQWL
jgi:hypothetical protein